MPPPPHEPPTRGGRLLIIATAALGLSLVGALAMRMTPGTTSHRDALGAVTSSSILGSVGATDSFAGLGAASTSRLLTELLSATLSSIASSADTELPAISSPLTDPSVRLAVVTPIGDDGLGLTTEAAVSGRTGTIEAMLPSGATVTAELVGMQNGVAIVQLDDIADVGPPTLAGKPRRGEHLTVMAYGDQFSVGEDGANLQSLDVPEAAPVLDADGNLIGLCTIGPDGLTMLPVETLPDVDPPPPESTEPETTAVVVSTETMGTTGPRTGTQVSTEPPTTTGRASSTTETATTETPTTVDSVRTTDEPTESSAPESTGAP